MPNNHKKQKSISILTIEIKTTQFPIWALGRSAFLHKSGREKMTSSPQKGVALLSFCQNVRPSAHCFCMCNVAAQNIKIKMTK